MDKPVVEEPGINRRQTMTALPIKWVGERLRVFVVFAVVNYLLISTLLFILSLIILLLVVVHAVNYKHTAVFVP